MPNEHNPFIDWESVYSMLQHAKARFLRMDSDLLRLCAHEVSVTAKFACYLQYEVSRLTNGINVDCEYTRVGNVPNRQPKRIAIPATRPREQERRPDIIIHERGNPTANFVVIEAKWSEADSTGARQTLAFLASNAQLDLARDAPDFGGFCPYLHAVLMTLHRNPAEFGFERLGEDEIENVIREARG